MKLVLFQPDIPQNVGACLRAAACFGASLDLIEPCGFALTAKSLRRAAMDYAGSVAVTRHESWSAFAAARAGAPGRLVLLTTRANQSVWDAPLQAEDALLLGRESVGAPDYVHGAADVRIRIPLAAGARSLNMAMAAGIALAEARRCDPAWPPAVTAHA